MYLIQTNNNCEDGIMRMMICEKCRKSVPISDIKYLPVGKDSMTAVCTDCRDKNKVMEKLNAPPKKEVERPAYFCTRCRYKFKYNPQGDTALKCPYCGKTDKVVENKTPSADTLVKNAYNE
jgi:transcription initiation factor IIE alpha subunit